MATESFSKEFKLTTKEQVEKFLEILENHKFNGENEYDFLLEWINSYIDELQNIKTEILINRQLNNIDNKELITQKIKEIFEIIDCFYSQKKLYDKFNKKGEK